MRNLFLALICLTVPAVAVAQQADIPEEPTPVRVQLEQTVPAAADVANGEAAGVETAEVRSTRVVDEAAAQAGDPTTARWWWLVGAIVVAGVLLAAIL